MGDFVDECFEIVIKGSDIDGSIIRERGYVLISERSGWELIVLQALVVVSAQIPVAILGGDEGNERHSLDEMGISILLLYLYLNVLGVFNAVEVAHLTVKIPQTQERVPQVLLCDLLENAAFVVYLVLGLVNVIVQSA